MFILKFNGTDENIDLIDKTVQSCAKVKKKSALKTH
jgi:hypothetical protein